MADVAAGLSAVDGGAAAKAGSSNLEVMELAATINGQAVVLSFDAEAEGKLRDLLAGQQASGPAELPAKLTAMEVARRYKVSVRTVRNWQDRQLVPFEKVGRCVRFDPVALDAATAKFMGKNFNHR